MAMASPSVLRVEGGTAFFEGDLTLAQTRRMLEQGKTAIQNGASVFDLSQVRQMDSSAISLLLGLRRFAQAQGRAIEIQSVSESLRSLANLYGVAEHL
jgi:phospholipid transport system transporter-binding protein